MQYTSVVFQFPQFCFCSLKRAPVWHAAAFPRHEAQGMKSRVQHLQPETKMLLLCILTFSLSAQQQSECRVYCCLYHKQTHYFLLSATELFEKEQFLCLMTLSDKLAIRIQDSHAASCMTQLSFSTTCTPHPAAQWIRDTVGICPVILQPHCTANYSPWLYSHTSPFLILSVFSEG